MVFVLTSPAFKNGAPIHEHYTCDGADASPPLSWSGAPAGTKSFALLCDDPDAPGGTWHHWAVYGIPASATNLPESYPPTKPGQAINDFGRPGYGGPCPPRGNGPHRYRFRLLALKVETLDFAKAPRCLEVEPKARPHILATAELVGTYSR